MISVHDAKKSLYILLYMTNPPITLYLNLCPGDAPDAVA